MRYWELTEDRVDELMGVKKFANMDHMQVLEYLDKEFGQGSFKTLGLGANGVAMAKGQTVYKFWLKDSAYEDFVRYAAANSQNPFLPKFSSRIKELPAFFTRAIDAPDTVRYVKMERLADGGTPYIQCTNEIGHMKTMHWCCEHILLADHQDADLDEVIHVLGKLFTNDYDDDDEDDDTDYDAPQTLTNEFKLLIKTVMEIMRLGNHQADFHDGNFLSRGDQPVIIDPISNRADLALNSKIEDFATGRGNHQSKPGSRRTK